MYSETKHLPFKDAVILLSRFGYQPEDIAIALNHSVSDIKRIFLPEEIAGDTPIGFEVARSAEDCRCP
jgi:hypothetical protein